MALPTNLSLDGGMLRNTGIRIGIFPSTTVGVPIELQHSSGASAATSRWTSVVLPPSTVGPVPYTLHLPLSTQRTYFRARHTGGGYGPGAFTPTINARPVVLPWTIKPVLINAGGNIEAPGSNVIISSGNRPTVGSQNSTSYISKTLLVPHAEAVDKNISSVRVRTQVAYCHPSSATTANTASAVVSALLPQGVTVVQWKVHCYRATTKDIATFSFNRNNTSGGGTVLGSLTHSTIGWKTLSSSALNDTVTSTRYYSFDCGLKGATNNQNARFGAFEILYQMPDYSRVI